MVKVAAYLGMDRDGGREVMTRGSLTSDKGDKGDKGVGVRDTARARPHGLWFSTAPTVQSSGLLEEGSVWGLQGGAS